MRIQEQGKGRGNETLEIEDAKEFQTKYTRKGNKVLDEIFGEFSPERARVRLSGPRQERQVVFVVEYEEQGQFANVITNLCAWLEQEGNFESLKGLMLS